MCKIFLLPLLLFSLAFSLFSAIPDGMMEVERTKEDKVIVRSHFSENDYLIREAAPGRNKQFNFTRTYLQNKKTGKKVCIHYMGDDVPSFMIHTTYIAANHGCSDGETVEIKNHKFTEKDLGKKVLFGKKVFYIVGIPSPHTIGILSEPRKTKALWSFARLWVKRGSKVTLTIDGKNITGVYKGIHQFLPSVRFLTKEYIANGKPLPKGAKRICSSFTAREVYEVLKVDEALLSLKRSPGKPLNVFDESISPLVRSDFSYIFHGDGSCVVDSRTTPLRDLFFKQYLGIMSVALLRGKYSHRYYIPKLLPFDVKMKVKGEEVTRHFDFVRGVDFSILPFPGIRGGKPYKNLADPNSFPDAFIQFLCKKEGNTLQKEVGFALGFCVMEGAARQENWEKTSSSPLWIYKTRKTYPLILENSLRKKGDTIHIMGYRHYFHVPSAKVPGSLYSHVRNKYRYYYYDSHENTPDFLLKNVPEGKIEVVEVSPALTLARVEGGVKIRGKKPYGRAVFRVMVK